uniref:Uncharacterized protein n=1 Tax=Schizaphis graminum TaxID=13262 RepID=A0A2S2ND46_SCHGA
MILESVQLVVKDDYRDNTPETLGAVQEMSLQTSPITTVTNRDELVGNESEVLDIATSPIAEEDDDSEMSSKEDSTSEEGPVEMIVTNLLSKNQGHTVHSRKIFSQRKHS